MENKTNIQGAINQIPILFIGLFSPVMKTIASAIMTLRLSDLLLDYLLMLSNK